MKNIKGLIENGMTYLGIELGSTRIKAVLIDDDFSIIANGEYEWENQLINGYWTYDISDVRVGLKACYMSLKRCVYDKYGIVLKKVSSIGISGMMHGYLALDEDYELLAPFRTWRNITAAKAADILSKELSFNIPDRWSVAHLYQAIIDKEEHISKIRYITTLAGYVHTLLTGEKVLGIGDCSGMFPIDSTINDYDMTMIDKFNSMTAKQGFLKNIYDLLPKVMVAGETAGYLSKVGVELLDADNDLESGIPMCAPEGDAGTGMVATNSVKMRTGNISAGTSIFAMLVLEKALKNNYREIDMVTTPSGNPVAMVHANNCTSDLNAWVSIFKEFCKLTNTDITTDELFSKLYNEALNGDASCGGLLPYAYISGESITKVDEGRPMFIRKPSSKFTLANFMRANLSTTLGAVRIGMDLLTENEDIKIDKIYGHGGFFKTKRVGQYIMAQALNMPVCVLETADNGGAWGIAILASYLINKGDTALDEFLSDKVFKSENDEVIMPCERDVTGFNAFMESYKNGIELQRVASKYIK